MTFEEAPYARPLPTTESCHSRHETFASSALSVVEHRREAPVATAAPFDGMDRRVTLGFVRHGLVVLEFERSSLPVDVNHVVVIPAGMPYEARHVVCCGEKCATTMHLAGEDYRFLFGAVPPRRPSLLPRSPRLNVELSQWITRSRDESSTANERRLERLLGGVRDLACGPDAPSDLEGIEPSTTVRRALGIIASTVREPLRLSSLARRLGCSKYHICRLFKRETGMTLTRYVHRIRVNESMLRLAEGEDDLSGLAFDLGFASHSHFTSVFRREVGMPPSQVREGFL